jgi:hypothetical protein
VFRGAEKIIENKIIDNFRQAIMYCRLSEGTIIDCGGINRAIQL